MFNRFLTLFGPPTLQPQTTANYSHDIQELLEDKNTILDTIISKTTEYPLLQAECIKAQKSILNHTRRIEAINISALNQQNNQQILKRNVNVQEMFKSVEREANRSVVGTLTEYQALLEKINRSVQEVNMYIKNAASRDIQSIDSNSLTKHLIDTKDMPPSEFLPLCAKAEAAVRGLQDDASETIQTLIEVRQANPRVFYRCKMLSLALTGSHEAKQVHSTREGAYQQICLMIMGVLSSYVNCLPAEHLKEKVDVRNYLKQSISLAQTFKTPHSSLSSLLQIHLMSFGDQWIESFALNQRKPLIASSLNARELFDLIASYCPSQPLFEVRYECMDEGTADYIGNLLLDVLQATIVSTLKGTLNLQADSIGRDDTYFLAFRRVVMECEGLDVGVENGRYKQALRVKELIESGLQSYQRPKFYQICRTLVAEYKPAGTVNESWYACQSTWNRQEQALWEERFPLKPLEV